MKKIKWALVASGSGTDANAIMSACKSGKVDNSEVTVLISTKSNAGCLNRAAKHKVATEVVDKSLHDRNNLSFSGTFERKVYPYGVDAIFFVGNVVVFNPPPGILTLNIHPADPKKHGGRKMYGLAVHKHVLAEIRDEIKRGWRKADDRFFTMVTVHEVSDEPDQGEILCQTRVEIPKMIIRQLMEGKIRIGKLAEMLQKHVLPYEWLMLPMAVEMAARKLLERKEGLAKFMEYMKKVTGPAETHNFPKF